MKVGLKDIAVAAGVSVMTVSRALRNAPGIGAARRRQILRLAEDLGYVRNKLASSMVARRTQTVGVILPEIEHTIFPAMLRGLEDVLSAAGYSLLFCCSYENAGKEYNETLRLLENRVDGIIMTPVSMRQSLAAAEAVRRQHCPLVLMDRRIPDFDCDSIVVDDFEGAYSAVMHLVQQGCQRIGHLGGNPETWVASERLRGYRGALAEAGMAWCDEHVIVTADTVAGGEFAMKQMLDRKLGLDAVFCVNDPVALGAFRTLSREGFRVPEDIALVGFSATLDSEIMRVPLTSVFQDGKVIGEEAARTLLGQIHGHRSAGFVEQVLRTHLIVRQSSQRLGRT